METSNPGLLNDENTDLMGNTLEEKLRKKRENMMKNRGMLTEKEYQEGT